MQAPLTDCYVMASERSAGLALRFLDQFIPNREATWGPADPVDVLGVPSGSSLEEILRFLERHVDRDYSMYLRNNADGSPYFAILAYRRDGSLILGLSTDEGEQMAQAELRRLEQFSGSKGYWSVEEGPLSGRAAFIERLEREHPSK